MKIIIGLGNPGAKYENTYHNMGFLTVQAVAEKLGRVIKNKECSGMTVVFSKRNKKIILALPQTFMNLSGECVKSLLSKYDATPSDIVVVYDDVDIPQGTLRLRKAGSAGTHNGMKDIVARTGTTTFNRIRVGIGHKPEFMDMADYVLSDMTKGDKDLMLSSIDRASDALVSFINEDMDFDALMQKHNG